MGCLPDELWTKVLRMGVEAKTLDYRDLCSLAFVSRRLGVLASLDCVWQPVWEHDFEAVGRGPSAVVSKAPGKRKEGDARIYRELYKSRFEKVKAARMASHRRRVLRVESQVAVMQKEAQHFQSQIEMERKLLTHALMELRNIELARRSAVAVQVWQPNAVRARQHEVLEQQPVNSGARQRSLEMEISVCRKRIQQFEKSLHAKRRSIEKSARELEALTFNPSRELHDGMLSGTDSERGAVSRKAAVKRKRDMASSSSQTP